MLANPIDFERIIGSKNSNILSSMNSPFQIQAYLDSIPYVSEELNRSPALVMLDQQCHCLDGGLFSRSGIEPFGFRAQIIDLVPEPGSR